MNSASTRTTDNHSPGTLQIALFVGLAACVIPLCYQQLSAFSSFGALIAQALRHPTHPAFFDLVQPSHNSYLSWRLDPLLSFFVSISASPISIAYRFAMVIFACGTALVLCRPARTLRRIIWSISAAIVITATIFALFGDDLVIWSTIAYLPLFLAVLGRLYQRGQGVVWWFFGAITIATLIALNSPWLGLTALLWTNSIALLNAASELPRRFVVLVWAAILAPAFVVMTSAPLPLFPHYPPLAQVVPDDGIAGMLRPLVGPSFPIPTVDRAWIRLRFFVPALTFAALGTILALWAWRLRRALPGAIAAVLFLAIALALDTTLPESLSQIAPISAISRLIPGLAMFAPPALGFALLVALAAPVVSITSRGMVLLLGIAGTIAVGLASDAAHPLLQRRTGPVLYHANEQRAPELKISEEKLISPSYAVYRARAESLHLNHPGAPKVKAARNTKLIATVTTSHHPELAALLIDGARTERWSPMKGEQTGGEYIFVTFQEPTEIRGIKLRAGAYGTDFPAGLSITGATATCESAADAATPILDLPVWQGTIHAIRKSGHPYYGSQETVRIPLPPAPPLTCLKITQTGTRSFDWSVTELAFYVNHVAAQP